MAVIRSRIHIIAAWLVRTEAIFLFGLGAYLLIRTLTSSVDVLANLIAMGVAYYMIDGERLALGLTLGTYALITFIAALASIPRTSTK